MRPSPAAGPVITFGAEVGRMGRKPEPDIERELERRRTEEKRQSSGSTPTEDEMERALAEEDVERHWGEDAGEVPDDDAT